MTVKLKSVPVSDLNVYTVEKMAQRYGVSIAVLRKKHVLFLDDRPNQDIHPDEEDYDARVVSMAVLVDSPLELKISAVGSSIKSPYDKFDEGRGNIITLSRAVRALGM